MTMANWFEDLSRTLADDTLSRRQVVRRIAGTVVGVAFAFWFPEQALANHHQCSNPGNACGVPEFTNCENNPHCFCFQRIDHGSGKGVCGCSANPDCSSYKPC